MRADDGGVWKHQGLRKNWVIADEKMKVLTGRIKICQGCRIPFHSAGNIQAPYDLVVCRKECRPYRSPDGQTNTPSVPSNSRYHVNLLCIRAAEPTFRPEQLVVPDDVHEYFSEVHKQYIFSVFGHYL